MCLFFMAISMLRGYITVRFLLAEQEDILYKALINMMFLVVNLLWCVILTYELYKIFTYGLPIILLIAA